MVVSCYVLRYTNADSYHSITVYPIQTAFIDRDVAEKVAREQNGYGLGVDWFVEEWTLDCS